MPEIKDIAPKTQQPIRTEMTSSPSVSYLVTIDGPAASGKSSVSRELASRMGWSWVSTGAFYRGLAYVAFRTQADIRDEEALAQLAVGENWAVRMTSQETCVLFENQDVTADIGREEIGNIASKISSFPKVRQALLNAQRQCVHGVRGLIAEGRDCGTVVFPHAQVKIFLTARAEDRAARRAREEGRDLNHLINEQKKRDSQDANRKAAPMQASADSHTIDTTDLTLSEVVDRVEALIHDRFPQLQN